MSGEELTLTTCGIETSGSASVSFSVAFSEGARELALLASRSCFASISFFAAAAAAAAASSAALTRSGKAKSSRLSCWKLRSP